MKKIQLFSFTVLLAILFVVTAMQCNNNPPPPAIKQYSYTEPIVNPPDSFQVIFNISTLGDKFAYVTFDKNAVWLIEKLGDGRLNFAIQNDTATVHITKTDTLALKAGYQYTLVANNNNYEGFTNLFTQFTRLNSLNYDDFEPKF